MASENAHQPLIQTAAADPPPPQHPSGSVNLLSLAIQAGLGAAFSSLLIKGQVFEPSVIQDQMQLKDFTMMAFMLGAISASQISNVIMWFSIPSMPELLMKCRKNRSTGFVAAIIGGGTLGVGMSLAGVCPGTMTAQLGSFTKGAGWVLVGGILGSLLYGTMEETCKPLKEEAPETKESKIASNYVSFAVPSAIIFAAASVAIYSFLPHQTLPQGSWHPSIAGACLGILQIPSWLLTKDPLGASAATVALSSYLTPCIPLSILPALSQPRKFLPKALPKVAWIVGAVGGAALTAAVAGVHPKGISNPAVAVTGGVMVLVGARLAGGCTSGHGVSGMSLLQPTSLIVVCSIFAGGLLTSLALGRFGFPSF